MSNVSKDIKKSDFLALSTIPDSTANISIINAILGIS